MNYRIRLDGLQPSQLFISAEKLKKVLSVFPDDPENLEPLPVKRLRDRTVLVDGHTRAVAAYLRGMTEIKVYWEQDDLDWEAYDICVGWCLDEGIHGVPDLASRVVGPSEYEKLWYERCRVMQTGLASSRRSEGGQ